METAGAEALSVFPSENPSRHIRISTAKKVCWDFILCNAWWFPGALLPAWAPGAEQGKASFLVHPGRRVASSKSHSLNRWGWEKAVRKHSQKKTWMRSLVTQFTLSKWQYSSGWASRGEWVWFNECQQNAWWFIPKGGLWRDKNELFYQHLKW